MTPEPDWLPRLLPDADARRVALWLADGVIAAVDRKTKGLAPEPGDAVVLEALRPDGASPSKGVPRRASPTAPGFTVPPSVRQALRRLRNRPLPGLGPLPSLDPDRDLLQIARPIALEVRLKAVVCEKRVGRILQDHMRLGAVADDERGRAIEDLLDLGRFGRNDVGDRVVRDDLLHRFDLPSRIETPWIGGLTLLLAEKDVLGGLKKATRSGVLPGREIVSAAIFGLGQFLEDSREEHLGLEVLGFVVAIAALICLFMWIPQLAGGLLVGGYLAKMLDTLREARDDVFDPVPVPVLVLPDLTAILTRPSPMVVTHKDGGRYRLELEAKVITTPGIRVRPAAGPPVGEAETAKQALINLDRVQRIFVLMLENRSFDHLCGYLRLNGVLPDLDGLRGDESNFANILPPRGQEYQIKPMADSVFPLDPPHSLNRVATQINGGQMDGFVQAFRELVEFFEKEKGDEAARPTLEAAGGEGIIMRYHTADHLPTFDLFARRFVVCDRWFSSMPGNTFPNRMFATCGTSFGQFSNAKPGDRPSLFRRLDSLGVSWEAFAGDLPSMWGIDREYFLQNRQRVAPIPDLIERLRGNGPAPASVVWIEPNYIDVGRLEDEEVLPTFGSGFPATANDDHPPGDVLHGQYLISELFWALFQGPYWDDALFLVTYDEHGGFFDHVAPPLLPQGLRDLPNVDRFGIRVPAFVVSPFTGVGEVSHRLFHHGSIFKTIFTRFARRSDGSIPFAGPHLRFADHLGWILNAPADEAERRADLVAHRDAWTRVLSRRRSPVRRATSLQEDMAELARDPRIKGAWPTRRVVSGTASPTPPRRPRLPRRK